MTPPPQSIFGLLRGKIKNVLELPKNHFNDVKKVADFPYVKGGRGVNQHIENSICFVVFIFESFPKVVRGRKRGPVMDG